jgi:sugar phosphate isomerase/epimerase
MHERISVNSMCFMGSTLIDVGNAWRDLGVRRVSFISQSLFAEGIGAARDALATGRYKVETIAHPFMPGQQLEAREESWRGPRATLMQLIDMAVTLGARSIYLLTGGHGSLTWEQAAECFSQAIAPCVARAKETGIALLIENALPLYAELHIAHSLRDTLTLAEMAGIGVNIDVYGCWTEAGLRTSIERAIPRCHVVQLSDYVYGDRALPSRAVPGDGAIPLERILGWILGAGYTGAFDLELLGPRIDKEGHVAAARRTCEYLGNILTSLGA